MVDTQCVATPREDRGRIIISNGGEKTLNLQSGGRWQRANGDLECWRKEALALHGALEEAFSFWYKEGPF